MTVREHANKVKAMKAKITREHNRIKNSGMLLKDKVEAYRAMKALDAELLEFKLNFYSLTRAN